MTWDPDSSVVRALIAKRFRPLYAAQMQVAIIRSQPCLTLPFGALLADVVRSRASARAVSSELVASAARAISFPGTASHAGEA